MMSERDAMFVAKLLTKRDRVHGEEVRLVELPVLAPSLVIYLVSLQLDYPELSFLSTSTNASQTYPPPENVTTLAAEKESSD